MRLLTTLALAATSASAASLTLSIPSSQALPNPYTLPPSTHATLSSLGETFSAPLSVKNTFVFHNLTGGGSGSASAGSYLVDIHCATHAFAPLRLDVDAEGGLAAWETYRGNDWDNKGEAYAAKEFEGGAKGFEVRVLGQKNYFVERSKFSILTILKNPMILLGLISMGIFLGMPYLMDNMDPEMRAEFEERQKSNPMNSLLGGGGGGGDANPMANFDMAGFLAGTGTSSKKEESSGSGASSGGAGGKKEKGVRR
ncbi:hypothetical protein HER10_EVM0006400 [Colletotrichum scovillei]|uniref:ER membrane protein complex subunit-like protein n=1 Tax=Colletotrichum scovillei TaxID=1209932 RepID=A0A9P7UDG1_9PEZI|nr:uncharacterized protein HER10_EVM0006400 [Colletotrichum scovillei]KAF4776463.1 hypothetical protein HER10_EVM0006400 [Colletotrichum scovillei]KAG7047812.1 ER membrane protein complex subunit-like protein [Colletotrichum scovillei]KAG7060127.1 ER membrane protein complex subunit-like protein [Colletotrichum scovillei]KAG7067579.1 ER membrane protein complex subunit-like protein [Colletotrichum scovillei]